MTYCFAITWNCSGQIMQQKNTYPWNYLLAAQPDKAQLQEVMEDQTLETRHKILAANLLLRMGISLKKELFAAIIEVAVEEGLDVVAAYKDGTARYLNHSEKMIFWDTKTVQSTALIQQLFSASGEVVQQIGPWKKARLPFPSGGKTRLSFLVSDGLYFGEGLFNALYKDPKGRPVIDAAIALMTFLIDQNLSAKN